MQRESTFITIPRMPTNGALESPSLANVAQLPQRDVKAASLPENDAARRIASQYFTKRWENSAHPLTRAQQDTIIDVT